MTEHSPLEAISFVPIGLIRSPFVDTTDMPIQAAAATGIAGRIELDPRFAEGLADLGGFSHLILLYHLHRIVESRLVVTPFLDDEPHGIFATRAPARPNPIGLSTVRLISIDNATLHIEDVDVVDGTPLLDIKPYVPALDDRADPRIGWYAGRLDALPTARADDRFGDAKRG